MHDLRNHEVGGKRTCEPGENGRQHPKECEFENIGPQYVRSRCAENLEDDSVINTRPMPGGNGAGKHEDTGGNRQTGGAFQGQSDIAQSEQGLTGPIANVTVRRHEHSCAFWSSTCRRRAVPFRRYCVMPAGFKALGRIAALAATLVMAAGEAAADEARLAILGDSLAAGFGLAAEDAFPAQLENALRAQGLYITVLNAGVSGDTYAGGRARFD